MGQINKLKGYVDVANVCMTRTTLKKYEYGENNPKNMAVFQEFKSVFEIQLNPFLETLKYLKRICGEYGSVKLIKAQTSLIMEFDNDLYKSFFKIPTLNDSDCNVVKSKFSINYLLDFFKSFDSKQLRKMQEIKLMMGNDYPIKIDVKDNWLILAPIIEN